MHSAQAEEVIEWDVSRLLSAAIQDKRMPWPVAISLSERFLGGLGMALLQGVKGSFGLNNIGLLIRTFGTVTYIDRGGAFFDVWDGSAVRDGNGQNGVRIAVSGLQLPAVGQFITVTGISSCYASGTNLYPMVRVSGQGDISVAAP